MTGGHNLGESQVGAAPGHGSGEAHFGTAGGHSRIGAQSSTAPGYVHSDAHPTCAGGDSALLLLADTLDDLESARKALSNRLWALENVKDVPAAAPIQRLHAGLEALEHAAVLDLQRAARASAYGPWLKATIGVGLKQGARLLAAIGDPYWNDLEDRPRRGPAELWAYCGYKPGQRRQRGVKGNWNATAKMRAHLIAESCIKQARSPYRPIYDHSRARDAEMETSDLHKHNRALRKVAKALLADLWVEGKRLHALAGGQLSFDSQSADAPGHVRSDVHRPSAGSHTRAESQQGCAPGQPCHDAHSDIAGGHSGDDAHGSVAPGQATDGPHRSLAGEVAS